MTASGLWAEGWTDSSYWLDGVSSDDPIVALPRAIDVLIVGSGYTGLNAAIETARAGRSTLVLDKDVPGFGCSSRNGGQIGTSVKPSLTALTAKFGAKRAEAMRREGEASLEWIEERLNSEQINCAFERCGRFHAAHTPQHYEVLAREAETMSQFERVRAHAVPRRAQQREIGSEMYHGGVVFPRHAALDPVRYHSGLRRATQEAGAQVMGNCAVVGIEKVPDGFEVETVQGKVHARDVIVATNGYTGPNFPWLARRVLPIGSYMIATEPLPLALMDRLFPQTRVVTDTCKVIYYFRPSPDRTRVLFGGRVSSRETNAAMSGPRLHEAMCRVFPELSSYQVTHSWLGFVAYTFDELPHTGTYGGIHYAMGYCGSGVAMASYLGTRVGQKVLGHVDGRTAFDDLPFPTRPLYGGKPWFLPALVAWYRWRDRMQYQRAKAAG